MEQPSMIVAQLNEALRNKLEASRCITGKDWKNLLDGAFPNR
ncbi:hypothetical protein [Chitinophaga sp.]|nr:hypothetical protein [Chitinophaga sp.]HWV67283.1 hypothetical protein [Chitinophaga sp.]